MNYKINNVIPGEHFIISVWRYKYFSEGCIIACTEDVNKMYIAQHKSSGEIEGNWELMTIDVIIPSSAANSNLKVYLMHTGEYDSLIFDDFSIWYVEERVPKTKNPISSFIDERDHKQYKTVKIGNDWWMSEGLKYNIGNLDFIDTNNFNAEQRYLYSFDEAKSIAPKGWRIPSDEDWMRLEESINLSKDELRLFGNRGSNHSYLLKEFGSSGFEAKPTGVFSNTLYNSNIAAYYWTSTEIDSLFAICREINHRADIGRFKDQKNMLFSIRCIKN